MRHYRARPIKWFFVQIVLRTLVLLVMRTLAALFLVFAFSSPICAQRSIDEMDLAHAEALRLYLAIHKNVSFRPESILSDEYLSSMRDTMGRSFKPNYAVGDFNGDGRRDFAVLLKRDGKRVKSGATSAEHEWDLPLRLVVFNGNTKGFAPVFTQDLSGPLPALITFTAKKLHYGVFETDSDDFYLKPTAKGYVVRIAASP